MTQLSGACWAVTDDATGHSGTPVDSAWVDAVEASINAEIHSGTNPTISPANLIDEVVEARGNFDSLAERIDAIVDVDGVPVTTSPRGVTQTFRGLHLRTAAAAADADHKVDLLNVREIVYQDGRGSNDDFGQIDTTVLPLTADIEVAGAGGLDTGAEAISAWYEIYAIRSPSTGVQNLLLHRAPYISTDVSHLVEDGAHALRRATAPVNTKLAQSFTTVAGGEFPAVDVTLVRAGAVSGNVWFTVEADVAGEPSGVPLATSNKLDASLISTTAQLIRFVFRTPTTLGPATVYHLVLQGDYAASDAVNISWRADTAAAGYAGGSKAFYDGAAWTADADDDFVFSILVTVGNSVPVLPDGYTQYCLIGYVYNESTGDFKPFVAFDRKVSPLSAQVIAPAAATAVPLLTGIAQFIPPVRVALNVVVDVPTGVDVCVGPVPDGVTTAAGDHRLGGAVRFEAPALAGDTKIELAPILTQYQAIYLSSNGGSAFGSYVGMWEWF